MEQDNLRITGKDPKYMVVLINSDISDQLSVISTIDVFP